jgi:phage repressor protein C with HTH and peptisase S24 domain
MGETSNPTALIESHDRIATPDYNIIKLPVLSMSSVVCAGEGFSLEYVDEEIESYEYIAKDDIGPIDEYRGPFVVPVEGDSMEPAGIYDGSKVAINPAVEVRDGNPALVCYGINKEKAVKWVYWQTDGGVEIRSANQRYMPRTFTKEDIELGFFFIIGKVMQVITRPLNG